MSRIADMPTMRGVYADAMYALGDILAYLRRADRMRRTAVMPIFPALLMLSSVQRSAERAGRQNASPMDGLEEVRTAVAHICKEVSEMEIEEPYNEPIDPDTPPERVEPKSPPRRAGSAHEGLAGVAATIQGKGETAAYSQRPRASSACRPSMPCPSRFCRRRRQSERAAPSARAGARARRQAAGAHADGDAQGALRRCRPGRKWGRVRCRVRRCAPLANAAGAFASAGPHAGGMRRSARCRTALR